MANSVVCYFVIILFIASALGKVAVKDTILSNEINKDDSETKSQDVSWFISNSTDSILVTVLSNTTNQQEIEKQNNDDAVYTNSVETSEPEEKVDNGTALILTPFIEDGRIEEGRKAAAVDPALFLGAKSFSGFLTVNKTYDSNTFFWYFPVPDKPVNETPWILWLQGGPGVSSLAGLFDEIGPFRYNRHQNILETNPSTWNQNHSLVFIDNPMGTGYSFTNHNDGLATDMATYTKHLYSAVRQLVQLFPELRVAPLIIAGESYAGKYVPALGMEVHRRKKFPGGDINLKGLMVGNAYMEPDAIAQIIRPYYHFGLLVKEQVQIVQPLVDAFRQDIAAGRSVKAKEKWISLITVLLNLSYQQQGYNFLQDSLVIGNYERFLQKSEVKRAIHVGDIKYSFLNVSVNTALGPEFLSNTKSLFETLLNHYDVMAYCGQLDQMLSCAVASEHYRKWQWDHSAEFLNATRYPLIFKQRLAGYYKTGGRFTEVLVRGAGHMAAMDAPAPMQWLVAQWTHSTPLPSLPYFSKFLSSIRDLVSNNTQAFYL